MAKTAQQDLNAMTVEELHEKARQIGISGTSHMRKDELIEALQGQDSTQNLSHTSHGNNSSNTDRPRDAQGHFEKTSSRNGSP